MIYYYLIILSAICIMFLFMLFSVIYFYKSQLKMFHILESYLCDIYSYNSEVINDES